MIINFILTALTTIIGAAFDLLPTDSLGIDTFGMGFASWGELIGKFMGYWDIYVNIGFIFTLVAIVVNVLMPAILTYKVLNWTYKHIPQLWGFGPGSG